MFNPTAPSIVTVPASGIYQINAQSSVYIDNPGTYEGILAQLRIRVNGTAASGVTSGDSVAIRSATITVGGVANGWMARPHTSFLLRLQAGDQVDLTVGAFGLVPTYAAVGHSIRDAVMSLHMVSK